MDETAPQVMEAQFDELIRTMLRLRGCRHDDGSRCGWGLTGSQILETCPNHRLGDAETVGDRLEGGGRDAVDGEEVEGGLEDPLASDACCCASHAGLPSS